MYDTAAMSMTSSHERIYLFFEQGFCSVCSMATLGRCRKAVLGRCSKASRFLTLTLPQHA